MDQGILVIMSGLRRLLLRLYHVVRPGAGEAELDRELRSHLTLLEDEYVRRGRTPEAARRAIGNMALVKDHQRDARSIRWVDDLLRDMRYMARRQRAAPAHTIVTVLTLALGIGASTAVFAVVNGLFLKSLPVRGADRLVHVYAQRPGGAYAAGFSLAEYASLRGHVRGLSALAAETEVAQLHVVVDAGSVEARGAFVTADYFSLMRVEAARGRTFSQDEDLVPGRSPVVLISDHMWRELFGADPQAVGREIRVNGVRMSVIGVTSPSFNGDDPGRGADVWIPAAMLDATGFGCDPGQPCPLFDFLVGRLADGVATARVEAEAAAVIAWQAALDPNQGRRRRLLVETATGTDPETRDALRPQMLLLAAVTGTLLLVICANLAGLSLARDSARKREFAVRMSLGATHGRLARQVHAESLVQGCSAA